MKSKYNWESQNINHKKLLELGFVPQYSNQNYADPINSNVYEIMNNYDEQIDELIREKYNHHKYVLVQAIKLCKQSIENLSSTYNMKTSSDTFDYKAWKEKKIKKLEIAQAKYEEMLAELETKYAE